MEMIMTGVSATKTAGSTADGRLDRAQAVILGAMIATVATVGTGVSLGMPLLALVLEARGIDATWIGINTAFGGLASIVVTPLVAPLARRIGTGRLLIASLALTPATFLAFYFAEAFWLWFPLRILLGFGLTASFVLSEFGLNSLSPAHRRGAIMGIYATVLSIGLGVGPIILASVGAHGFAPFAVGTLVLALGILPALVVLNAIPVLEEAPQRSVIGFVVGAPVATLAAFSFGAVESGGMTILPVYGLRLGFDETTAALLVTAVAFGNVLFQIPIGLLSDRIDRRKILAACAAVGVLGAAAIPTVAGSPWLLIAVLFVWGGVTAGLYTVGLIHLGARYSGADLASANAAFVMMYAVGILVGPPSIGAGLDLWRPHGAAVVMAALFGLYLAVVAGDLVRRRR
jgi:MFS family permease